MKLFHRIYRQVFGGMTVLAFVLCNDAAEFV